MPISPVKWIVPILSLPDRSLIFTSLNVADAFTVLLLELIMKPTSTVSGRPAVNVRTEPATYLTPPSTDAAAW